MSPPRDSAVGRLRVPHENFITLHDSDCDGPPDWPRNWERELGMKLFVVTATHLRDGAIRWLGVGDVWQADFSAAVTFDEAGIERALAFGAAEIRAQRVIGVYQIEVERNGSAIVPRSTRERIRAYGPTVHPEFSYAPAARGLGD